MSTRRATLALLRPVRWAVVLTLCALTAGCGQSVRPGETVRAPYPIGTKKVLLVPFSDPAMPCFESKNGNELARSIYFFMGQSDRRLQRTVILGTELPQSAKALGSAPETLMDIGRQLDVAYVLEGEILEIQTDNPSSPNILRGEVAVQFNLRDVNRWEPPLYSKEIRCVYPSDDNEVMLNQNVLPRQLLEDLLVTCGQRIAEHFVDYDTKESW